MVGVGSPCRRHVGGTDGLVAVINRLDRVLPRDVRLPGFGGKSTTLSLLASFGDRVASIDSQTYGIAARREAYIVGRQKTQRMVADHMVRWTARQFERRARSVPVQIMFNLEVSDPVPTDPWERALATARDEIRSLIADGEIDHEQITAGWVAEWAADRIAA